jgi:hypothetical protein
LFSNTCRQEGSHNLTLSGGARQACLQQGGVLESVRAWPGQPPGDRRHGVASVDHLDEVIQFEPES